MADEQETPNDTPTNWIDSLAGDNDERRVSLAKFETPDAFLENYDSMANRDWRDEFAGDDDKFKATLQRFSDPGAMGTSFREAQTKIRSGELNQPLAEDATEGDVKVWRETHGIPLEASGYLEDLPDGLILGDEDQPIAEAFMDALHSVNADPKVAHALLKRHDEFKQQMQDDEALADTEHRKATEDELREVWGSDYRANINLVGAMLSKAFPTAVKDMLLNARLGPGDDEGQGIMNSPSVMQGFAELARALNVYVPPVSTEGTAMKTAEDERDTILKFMRENRTEYNKDQKMQDRLLTLNQLILNQEAAA